MSSRYFPSKFENQCVKCGHKILVGQSVRFVKPGSKDLEHEFCTGLIPPKLGALSTPPTSPGTTMAGLPGMSPGAPSLEKHRGFTDSDPPTMIAMWVPASKAGEAAKRLAELR